MLSRENWDIKRIMKATLDLQKKQEMNANFGKSFSCEQYDQQQAAAAAAVVVVEMRDCNYLQNFKCTDLLTINTVSHQIWQQ